MSTILQVRRGNTAKIAAYIGPVGEIIFNVDTGRLHAQDGSTMGGRILALTSDIVGGGTGDGDMLASVYDPSNVKSDAFSMDHMREGATKKIMSKAERDKLEAIAANATQNSDDTYLLDLANATGNLAQSRIDGLSQSLSGKIDASQKNVSGGVAGLDAGGKISTSQLPQLAITDTFVVSSEAEMLALAAAERGDIAVRLDLKTTFILAGEQYNLIANWVELLSPTEGVVSIAGLNGMISSSALLVALNLNKVNNTPDAEKPISDSTQLALDEKYGTSTTLIDLGSL